MDSSRLARSSTTRAATIFVRLAGGSGSSAFSAKSSVPVEMSVTKTALAEIGGGVIGWYRAISAACAAPTCPKQTDAVMSATSILSALRLVIETPWSLLHSPTAIFNLPESEPPKSSPP